ncbi:ribulokinase [bacterium]|nr:MAG: ribulokinase [bacterium]
MPKVALGLDYGTGSVRALLVDTATGEELGSATYEYPHGSGGVVEDPKDPNLGRQHPADHLEGARQTIREVLASTGIDAKDIVGIGVDTTGSSPIPVDKDGVPLALAEDLKDDPDAMCWLWKDHTSHAEAAEITALAKEMGRPYLAKCGGTYSSEWFWSKILRFTRIRPDLVERTGSWVELADLVPAWLTGTLAHPQRGVCAAGHKAMYHTDWGGLPDKEFLAALHPKLAELRDGLYDEAVCSNHLAGHVTAEIAAETGLVEGTPVAVGAFDAHMGAVGSGVGVGTIVKIMGTSTCDIMVHPLDEELKDIPGVCGIVPGSVIPGAHGIEAGQSAVGDIFAWWAETVGQDQRTLTEEALKLAPGESGLVALDWHNGNRTILVDPLLTGLVVGQTIHTTAAEMYRAFVEATAYGSLKIIERIEEYGVPIERVVACGGIAEKSALTMQIYADVFDREVAVSRSAQTCALGAAVFGAVVGGAYPSVEEAQKAMTGVRENTYKPNPQSTAVYKELYAVYSDLHDAFGGVRTVDLGGAMKALIRIRDAARKG